MGYDILFFSASQNAPDEDVQYQIVGDGKELTFSLTLGDAGISVKNYSVTVSFTEAGRISAVEG